MEYIRDSKKTPRCRNCNNVVRPGVTLYGEQLDSHLTSLAATEVEKAEVLLLIGTKLSSDVYSNYVKFFEGEQIVVIHEKEHYTDCKADMVIYDQPGKVLSNLGYDFRAGRCQKQSVQTGCAAQKNKRNDICRETAMSEKRR